MLPELGDGLLVLGPSGFGPGVWDLCPRSLSACPVFVGSRLHASSKAGEQHCKLERITVMTAYW